MMDKNTLHKYAELVIKTGVNLQPNQLLVVNAPIECADFAREIASAAYDAGAADVSIQWKDETFSRLRYDKAPKAVFDRYPAWMKAFYQEQAQKGAAFVSIAAEDPELLKGVDSDKIIRAQKAANTALADYREKLMANYNAWCVVSVPTATWAKKAFPDLTPEAAVEALGKAIAKSVRVDQENPVVAWEEHKKTLHERMTWLNQQHFCKLRIKTELGTDLLIGFPEGQLWLGGAEQTKTGVAFVANMPTEEIYTLPDRAKVNGIAVASRPLAYNGNLIDGFALTFQDGICVECRARQGESLLRQLLATDAGASRLGEVALVPYSSPISQQGLLFYNTLFDENASSHLALGKAYPVCLANSEALSAKELLAAGVNDSLIHEDFMIGTADMIVVGETKSGEKITIMERGEFVL